MPSNHHRFPSVAILLLGACLSLSTPARPDAERVTVFAAASLADALGEVLPRERFPDVSLSFASSGLLARQIEAGAPVHIYIPAHPRWLDYLETHELVEPGTRAPLLANRLVVIAPRGAELAVEARAGFDFAGAFDGRLAIGDPDHVPAGIYAREALEALGWWDALVKRLAPTPHVRAALVFVERGECSAGIVYATDAAISKRVQIIAELPDSLHSPIRYPVAVMRGRHTPAAARLLAHLRSAAATEVFVAHGFLRVDAAAMPKERRAQP